MMKWFCAAGALALITACGASESPDAPDDTASETASDAAATETAPDLRLALPESTQTAITADDLRVRIRTLADDRFEGRAPGTETGEASADWIAAEMERVGLEPAGPDGGWFQTVEMVEQTIEESASGLTFSGGASERDFAMTLGDDAVIWTKRQQETELSFEDSEVVFVGYGVVAPEYGWDDYAGLDAEGKTVVMLVNDPGFATEDPDLFKGKAMTYYGRWTYKFEEAARQGAQAAIIVHETAPASYGWDVVSNSWSGAQADLVRADGGAGRTALEGWITLETARSLFADGGLDFEEMKRAARTPGFTPVEMGGMTASGEITQKVTRAHSRNIIGRLEGETEPDEYMLFTAHWDHLGKKSAEKQGEPGQDFYRDQIYNGAVDNATGVAGMIEIGEAMAAEPRERSALFLAVTLEESGLLGSAYYAENPTVPMPSIVAGINMDAMLPVGRTRDMVVVGYGASQMEDRLEAVLEGQDRVIKPDPKPEAGFFYRSDHVSLAKKGVPMLYADGGQDKRDGGIAAGKAAADAYTARRYHKPMDEYSEDWDLSGMEEDVRALYQVGLGIVQSGDWPQWYEGNEFKAIRDRSLAEASGE
ncbi:MAG: M28 family peptidase [Alphaproteobacteria bacterium]|jgi:Zn-dependent M28 family amino/carboxypeptidase|nr:M28 family peptidase [Alphaproteobacteria bacterium]